MALFGAREREKSIHKEICPIFKVLELATEKVVSE
jgi:hypothetical protein